jgi:hypothetical protein
LKSSRLRYLGLFFVVLLLMGGALACDLPGGGPSKPTIAITAPTNDAQFEEGEEVNVLSSAHDAKGVVRVELSVDGGLYLTDSSLGSRGEKSLAMAQAWTATDPGQHSLSVTAYNRDDVASAPWAVAIEVVGAGGAVTPPTPTSPGAPDLYISDIRLDPESPQMGSPVQAAVRIHNGGTVDSGPFRVIWIAAGAAIGCEWEVTNLAPGGAQWQECEYTYHGWDEDYTTTAVVDVDRDVDELDEDNNEYSESLDVRPPFV